MASLQERMIRAAKLDAALYEEVEADPEALSQAVTVVVIAAVAAGIGNFAVGGLGGIIGGAIAALIGWFVWAFLVYVIGTRLLPEAQTRTDMGELLRTLGFASSPGVLQVLRVIPGLGPLIALGAQIWMLAAMVIAVRQALDYESTGRAVGVCVIGWIVELAVIFIAASVFLPRG